MIRFWLLVLLLGVLAPWRLATAQESLLTDFYFRASSSAVNSRDEFKWPVTTDIDAVLKVDTAAPANAQVVIIVLSAGEIIAKYKGKHALQAGAQELRLPKVFATDKVLGQRLLTAQLELAVKGYAIERREITFDVKGPPQPKAEITRIRLYNPLNEGLAREESVKQFGVGQPFMIEVEFKVTDNPANLQPRLIVLASMVEDEQFTGYDLEQQTYEDHWEMKTIEMEEGIGARRTILHATLPSRFADPWNNHHPFHVYAALDFGLGGQRSVKSVESEVFDYTPSELRRADDPELRLTSIARANSWSITLPETPIQ